MDLELKNLIQSNEFQSYHKKCREPPRFNPFSVLQYSDYEIRHSNVLAWMLRPKGTHGLGDVFLLRFIEHLNAEANESGIEPISIPARLDEEDVSVERELDYVDITIRFRTAGLLIAIENKTEGFAPEHYAQVKTYEKRLREKYSHQYRSIRSVLLTTSQKGDSREREAVHVSWFAIHKIITDICRECEFGNTEVRTFLSYYLGVIERIIPQAKADWDVIAKLLGNHRHVLARLSDQRHSGTETLASEVSSDLRESLSQLVIEHREEPKILRSEVREFLRSREVKTRVAQGRPQATDFWLIWRMDAIEGSSGIEEVLEWSLTFTYDKVSAELFVHLDTKKTGLLVDRIQRFMRQMDIGSDKLVWKKYGRYIHIYERVLVPRETLARKPYEKIKQITLDKVGRFLDSDYRTIGQLFKCLAFNPTPN